MANITIQVPAGKIAISEVRPAFQTVMGSVRMFTTGVPTPIQCARLFDVFSQPLHFSLGRQFNIEGPVWASLARTFDTLGYLNVKCERRFDVIQYQKGSTVGIYLPHLPPVATTLADPVLAGAQSIEVVSGTGLVPGALFQLGEEYRAVAGRDDTTISFTVPLGLPHDAGAAVQRRSGFVQGVMVFDKAGVPLGLIRRSSMGAKRARNICSISTSCSLAIPSGHPDCLLLDDDRLVALQSDLGEPLWSGAMARSDSRAALVQRTLDEAFVQFVGGPSIDLNAVLSDGTLATTVYAQVLKAHNLARAAVGEITWESNLIGSKVYPGDFVFKGDTMDALSTIATRSQTEFAWQATIADGSGQQYWYGGAPVTKNVFPHTLNQLVLTLLVADRFTGAEFLEGDTSGVDTDFFDGPTGNLQDPEIIEDPTPVVNEITVTGQTTTIASLLPAWAQWAAHEITPTAHVVTDPGQYRRRADLTVQVDWTLSKTLQQYLADLTLGYLWDLYRSFLKSIHDIEGRPFHDGWRYPGPDSMVASEAGQDAMSRRSWRPRVQLLERYAGEPVAAVALSDESCKTNLREWMVVSHDRVSGVSQVTAWPVPLIQGGDMTWCTVKAGAKVELFKLSGPTVSAISVFDNSASEVDVGFAVTPWTNTITYLGRRYTLRLIIEGTRQGVWWVDTAGGSTPGPPPAVPGCTFAPMTPQAVVVPGEFVSKVYDFERLNVGLWDPRRDGIGQLLTRRSVYWGQVTSLPRWHRVSYGVGADASTSLVTGINATDTDFEVGSSLGWPDLLANAEIVAADPLQAANYVTSYYAQIEDGDSKEIVLVTGQEGSLWNVVRGQQGTTAQIHEASAAIKALPTDAFDGIHFPYTWDQGNLYAAELLARASRKQYQLVTNIVNRYDLWRSITLGSTHHTVITTEGPPGGFEGDVRVLGYAIDDLAGTWEVAAEVL